MKDPQISSRLIPDGSSYGLAVSSSYRRDKLMGKGLWVMGCLLLASLISSVDAHGQADAATIVGTVVDHSGAALANEMVTIINVETNVETVVKTTANGSYIATPLKIGNYNVKTEAPGFKPVTRTGIVLNVQDRLRVDFTLEVGTVNQQVTVNGTAPLLQSETSSLGTVIESQQITDLPLNGRDYAQLAVLTTGVTRILESGSGIDRSVSPANHNAGGAFAVNGVRGLLNNYMLDGIDNNSNDYGGWNVVKTSVDAVEEFKVQTSNYSAEFGRSGGAVINATTKSGTNSYHGAAFEFLRNSALDSRGFFEPAGDQKAPFRQNQFGFTFGGPVKRNKLFFFTNYQGTRIAAPTTVTTTVPLPAEINGDFSALLPDTVLYDPESTTVVGGVVTRTPFPGNVIPPDRFDTIAHNIISLYPLPNAPGTANNYVVNSPGTSNTDQGDVRVDYSINQKQQVFGRFSISHVSGFQAPPLPGLADGSDGGGNSFDDTLGFAIGHTWTVSSNIVNDLRVGLGRSHYANGVASYGLHFPPPELQVPGVPDNPTFNGLTLFQVNGAFSNIGYSGFAPTVSTSQEIQYGDTLSIVHGRHSLKVGAQFHRSSFDLLQLSAPRGSFTFDGQFTSADGGEDEDSGNPLADALLGIPFRSNITLGGTLHNRQNTYGGFVEDDIKVNSKLTLNLGLRYDYTTPIFDAHDQMSNLDFATGQLVLAGKNGASRGLVFTDKDDFAPRVGFAWQVLPHTVVRSGYGRFFSYQETRTGDPYQLYYNLPFVAEVNFTSDGITPLLTVSGGFPSINPNSLTGASVTTSAGGADTHLHAPAIDEWNLNVQHELPGALLLEVAYVGSKGTHLQSMLDLNQVRVPGPGDIDSRRPYTQFGGFNNIVDRGNSNYHALQVKAEKRLTHGLMFLSSFTYSKSLDDQPEICCANPVPQNSYDLSHEYGNSDFDSRLRWVTSFDYRLPIGRSQRFMNSSRVGDLVLGGWNFGGIFTMHSGFWFSPQIDGDPSNTGSVGLNRTDAVCNGNLPGSQHSIDHWYNIDCFPLPAQYTFGNAGKNILEGPGAVESDFSLRKVFNITESKNVEFRFELFNAFNHAVFALPDRFVSDGPGAAGTITSTVIPQRQLQFALKLHF